MLLLLFCLVIIAFQERAAWQEPAKSTLREKNPNHWTDLTRRFLSAGPCFNTDLNPKSSFVC